MRGLSLIIRVGLNDCERARRLAEIDAGICNLLEFDSCYCLRVIDRSHVINRDFPKSSNEPVNATMLAFFEGNFPVSRLKRAFAFGSDSSAAQ